MIRSVASLAVHLTVFLKISVNSEDQLAKKAVVEMQSKADGVDDAVRYLDSRAPAHTRLDNREQTHLHIR